MSNALPRDIRTNIDGVAVLGNAEVAVQLSGATGRMKILLLSVQIKCKTIVSAVPTFTPFLTDSSGATSTSIHKKWLGAATAIAGQIDVSGLNRVMRTDVNGYIYLSIGGDVADSYEYEICYEVGQ